MPIPHIKKTVRGNVCLQESGGNLWTSFVASYIALKARRNYRKIAPHLIGKKILDVGLGNGALTCLLARNQYDVFGVDIANHSLYDDVVPLLYDGTTIPFSDREFDTSLLLHVLHHCSDPLRVLTEAKRVAKRTIVIEDTYQNIFEKIAVSANDMVGNFEFYPHPYKKSEEWEKLFTEQGWSVRAREDWREFPATPAYGRYSLFVIE